MKLNDKQKNTLFKLLFFGILQVFYLFYYVIVSGFAGTFMWTVQELATNTYGTIMAILNLIMLVNGIIIFMYLVIYVIRFLKN